MRRPSRCSGDRTRHVVITAYSAACGRKQDLRTSKVRPPETLIFLPGSVPAPQRGMPEIIVPQNLESLTERIIGCGIAVHRALGPGLLESAYRECMVIELGLAGLKVVRELHVPILYRGQKIPTSLRLDLLVDDVVVVELKAVDKVHPIHIAQVISYLKLGHRPAGLLMNFNMTSLRQGLHRVDHPQVRGQIPRSGPAGRSPESAEAAIIQQSACPEL